MSYRELGTIQHVHFGNEDGRPSFLITIRFGNGGSFQGFQGMLEDLNQCRQVERDILAFFNVGKKEDLIGKRVYALRHFDGWNEFIDGIEDADTGRQWVRWRYFGFKDKPIDKEIASIKSDIAFHERRIREQQERLKTIRDHYEEW